MDIPSSKSTGTSSLFPSVFILFGYWSSCARDNPIQRFTNDCDTNGFCKFRYICFTNMHNVLLLWFTPDKGDSRPWRCASFDNSRRPSVYCDILFPPTRRYVERLRSIRLVFVLCFIGFSLCFIF